MPGDADLLAIRWSALALGVLEDGPRRFGELRRRLHGISPKVPTQTLRRLEQAQLVDRTVCPAVPLRQLRVWVEDNFDATLAPTTAGSSTA